MNAWLFIILFGTTHAQVITTNSAQDCLALKEFATQEAAKAKLDVALGCFKDIGGIKKES